MAARSALRRFWRDERGATAIEVGVLVALISVALIGILTALQGNLKISFGKVETTLDTANAAN
nr:Flp family type IVb pilin [Caulobacter sp. UNC279MFTsu5.1]